jgi:hypothetical protein
MNHPAERPQSDFLLPDDAFTDIFALNQSEVEVIEPKQFAPFQAREMSASGENAQSFIPDAGWHWHDAALIAVERASPDGISTEYAIGAVDLYASARTGDIGGSYLEIAAFNDVDRAADAYRDLQADIDSRMLLPFQLVDFASEAAHAHGAENPTWRTAGSTEYAAYEAMRDLNSPGMSDLPPADFVFGLPELPSDPVIDGLPLTPDAMYPDDITYSFGSGITEDGEPALQAVKHWQENDENRDARQTIDVFGMSEEAEAVAREFNAMLASEGLQDTMRLATDIATANGYVQPERDALFSDGPADAFTGDLRADPIQQFQDVFADGNSRLLGPADPAVNYSFDITEPDPFTMELRANKWWFGQDGSLHNNGLTLNSYSLESFEFERETEREIAAMDREGLVQTHREEGLEASMREAEAMAVANGELDVHREDGRLFYEGPPDRFTTLRERQIAGHEQAASVPERDEWQELLDRANNDKPDPEPHYWLLQHRSVETPDGEPLGTALVMIEFPQLTPDFGTYLEQHGMDDSVYPTEARRLEVAHFADEGASRKFETEFRSYLMPGVIDGPELAPEVATLEGLSGEWDPLGFRDIAAHLSGAQAIVKDTADWHLHMSEVERGAELRLEPADFDL